MRLFDELRTDVRHGLRQLARVPALATAIVGVLAVGIGANVVSIAYIDGLFRPPAPGVSARTEIVRLSIWHERLKDPHEDALDFDEYREFAAKQRIFSDLGASFTKYGVVVGSGSARERIAAQFVVGDFFDVFEPRMTLGTTFRAANNGTSAVISHSYWRRHFAGDSGVIGREIHASGVPFRIVGVLPAGFRDGPRRNDSPLWIPMEARTLLFASDSAFFQYQGPYFRGNLHTVGRMQHGTSSEAASAGVRAMPPLTSLRHPSQSLDRMRAVPLYSLSDDEFWTVSAVSAILGTLTLCILAIACMNGSILLLGRAVARQREIAVRLSLGASRWRVIRQLAVEGVTLAGIAGVLGVGLAWWGNAVFRNRLVEIDANIAPTWRAIAAVIPVVVGTGVAFALIPALHATRTSIANALKDAGSGFDRVRARLQRSFVVMEIAASVALVGVAGSMAFAARWYVRADAGMDVSRSVLTTDIGLDGSDVNGARAAELFAAIRARLEAVPGVERVGVATGLPERNEWARATIDPVGSSAAQRTNVATRITAVGGNYFEAAGVSIVAGRHIGDAAQDAAGAVISIELAERLWPGQNALGRTVALMPRDGSVPMTARDSALGGKSFTVVGLAEGTGPRSRVERSFEVYVALQHVEIPSDLSLVIRVRDARAVPVSRLAAEIRAVDPDVPVTPLISTSQRNAEHPSDMESFGVAASIAGGLALALACVGLFAVVWFAVMQRRREIGIRLALGATSNRVIGRFFGEGMSLALQGLVIGLPIALAVLYVMQLRSDSLTFLRPVPLAATVAILGAVIGVACWLPARHAARVHPAEALRNE